MSLDPQFLKSGNYNNERNPLAFQVAYSSHAHGFERDSDGKIKDPDGVITDLVHTVDSLTRAMAVLEDQLSELRGSRILPKNSLIHKDEWVDQAVVDPTIDW